MDDGDDDGIVDAPDPRSAGTITRKHRADAKTLMRMHSPFVMSANYLLTVNC
jgi:hypothetical protein